MNNTIDVMMNRVSLRRYDERPISKEHLDTILECAMRAPTAGNMMLYSIIHVEDENKKEILSRTCDNQPFIAKAPLVLVFLADYQRWYDYYIHSQVPEYCKAKGMEFEGPSEANLLLASCDAMIAAQNAVIAGESLGIGSCYIGDIMENYETHRELFDLPKWVFPIGMLCMGYYPEDYKRVKRERFDKKYIVYTDKYDESYKEHLEECFFDVERRFNKENKHGAKNMGQMHYAIKTGADFSKEMARSVREALKNWNSEIIE